MARPFNEALDTRNRLNEARPFEPKFSKNPLNVTESTLETEALREKIRELAAETTPIPS